MEQMVDTIIDLGECASALRLLVLGICDGTLM